MMNGKLLDGKVALITGASGKIGSAVAKRFVQEGASVILISRYTDNLNMLHDEMKKLEAFKEHSVTLIQLDLLDFESVKLLANKIVSLKLSESGVLDILIACAGLIGESNPVQDYALATFQNIINVNFIANWYLLKNLDSVLKRSNAGRVVFVTSEITSSPGSYPYWGAYAASQAALEIMIKIYASETKHTKLCTNALYLEGLIENEMCKGIFSHSDLDKLTDRFIELVSDDSCVSGEIFPLSKSFL